MQEFVAGDLNIQSTSKFAIFIQRDDRKYTLGDMNWIMQLIKPGGKTLSKSPLLQDFRNFALRYFEKRIVEKKYLDSINTINEEFRKKAAHPYVLGLELAKECQQLIRLTLKEFLASYLVQGR